MKIGHNTHPRRDMIDAIRWIGENGFDFVDLFFEGDKGSYHYIDPQKIAKALNDYGLDKVGHTAWSLPIGSEIKDLRQKAVEILQKHIEICSEIECDKMTVHAHWPSPLFNSDEGVKFQTDSLQQLADYGEPRGVQIIYESITTSRDNVANIKRILKHNPKIGFHADIGHLNLHGKDPLECMTIFQDRLAHIHMHDNDGARDLHLPIGCGMIDWNTLIKNLKTFYDGTITLEIFSPDKDYVLLSRRKLKEKWEKY